MNWDTALNEATNRQTLLTAHELMPNMLVKQVNSEKVWRVVGCYSPDGFALLIAHLVDQNNYDWCYLYENNGRMDERKWVLLDASKLSEYARLP